MKKRVVAMLLAFLCFITGVAVNDVDAFAQDAQDVSIEAIMTEDALIGYAQSQTWGVYLAEGYSIINDAGNGKIGCGGVTEAAVLCRVSVNAIVERKVDGSWERVTSWTSTNESAYTAVVSKTLSVGSGYYYRVRSVHYAGSDASSSCTDALYM